MKILGILVILAISETSKTLKISSLVDFKVDRQEEEDLEWVSSPLKEQKKFSIIFSKNCIIINLAAR